MITNTEQHTMKFNAATLEVEASGQFESAGFSFAASAKAFKIFIDGIYSDKIRAIVREIFTNAYDAHILAGKADVQFVCHLPSILEPHFSVRDFGPAIAHEDMMKRFTRVFDSTKDQSDDFVGSLGLGRLSPFAYTDNFTVVTRIDGTKRTYAVYMNSASIPELSLLTTEETDEENGFEVIVPVESRDTQAFWRAATFTCVGFDPKPICNDGFDIPQPKTVDADWAIYPNLSGVYAKQGCVIYPIDRSIFPENEYSALFSVNGLVLNFPIGSLEFNASREALGYTDRTKESIHKVFSDYNSKLRAKLQSEINAAATHRDAVRLYDHMKNLYNAAFTGGITYKGATLRRYINIDNATLKQHGMVAYAVTMKRGQRVFRAKHSEKVSLDLTSDAPIYVVRKDKKIDAISGRICEHVNNSPGFGEVRRIIVYVDDARGYARVLRWATGGPVILVETLPKPKTERSYVGREKNMVSVGLIGWEDGKIEQNMEDVDVTVAGLYLIREYNSLRSPSLHDDYLSIKHIFGWADKLGIDFSDICERLVTITPSQEERFKKKGWIEATEPLIELAKECIEATPNKEEITYYMNIGEYDDRVQWDDFDHYSDIIGSFGNLHPVRRGYALGEALKANYKNIRGDSWRFQRLLDMTKADRNTMVMKPSKLEADFKAVVDAFKAEFPMATFVNSINPASAELQILLDYLHKDVYVDQTETELQEAA